MWVSTTFGAAKDDGSAAPSPGKLRLRSAEVTIHVECSPSPSHPIIPRHACSGLCEEQRPTDPTATYRLSHQPGVTCLSPPTMAVRSTGSTIPRASVIYSPACITVHHSRAFPRERPPARRSPVPFSRNLIRFLLT